MIRTPPQYCPILRLKKSELEAVCKLREEVSLFVRPIFELVPEHFYDYEKGADKKYKKDSEGNYIRKNKDPKAVLEKKAHDLLDNYGYDRPAAIDFSRLTGEIWFPYEGHPLDIFYQEAQTRGLWIIPVTGLSTSYQSPEYMDALKRFVENDIDRGIVIRLYQEDMQKDGFPTLLQNICLDAKIPLGKVDILLDYRYISSKPLEIVETINSFPELGQWRTLTLIMGAMPNHEQYQFHANDSYEFERHDFQAWLDILDDVRRIPDYGDYTILSPTYKEYLPSFATPSAKIVWTTQTKFLMERGISLKNGKKGEQFIDLSRLIPLHDEFKDSLLSNCHGDNYLLETLDGSKPTPKRAKWLQQWIATGINHHISLTVYQLASVFS